MHLLKLLGTALVAALMTTSCASLPTPAPAPPQQLPAEYATQCPPPVAPASNLSDDAAIALKEMYDLYGICAGRLIDLVDWITRKK